MCPCSCLEDSLPVLLCSVCPRPCPCPLCGPGSTGRAWRGPAWWGQGARVTLHVTYSRATTVPALPQPPALLPTPGLCQSAGLGLHPRLRGGTRGVTPQCRDPSWAAPAPLRALHRGIRPSFSRAPGSGDPRPRSFPRPVSACGQRGPCQSCSDPPTLLLHPPGPLPSPRGATRGDSAGWVAAGRGACDSFARSRTQELTLRIPLWGLAGPRSAPLVRASGSYLT